MLRARFEYITSNHIVSVIAFVQMFDGALIALKQVLVCIQQKLVMFKLSLTPTCPTPAAALGLGQKYAKRRDCPKPRESAYDNVFEP